MNPGLKRIAPHYIMLAPFFIIFAVFFLYPIVSGLFYSFFEWDAINEPVFRGLGNYEKILTSRKFEKSITNLLLYVAITVPLGITIAFLLAVMVDSFKGVWGKIFRSAYFVPVMMPLFLAATIWRWIYAPNFGIINTLTGWFGFESVNFLNDTDTMLFALIAVDIWVSAGFNMVIILAGLKNVPEHLYEAARLDGATKLQELRYVTIPMTAPVLFFVITYGFISALQVFDVPWLLTASDFQDYGGRRQTLLFPVMDMMGRGFGRLRFGEAAAYGFILTFIIITFTAAMFAMRRRQK
uniref:carbohydrate ABC transporter permease n=1 Tax=Pararhizobium sp. IMCC3301 TaxID=3067904 RepID=UPI0027422A8D|nr:sugar ABC transporter permease [Pararhizobium sp. IMCC3301]